MAKGDQKVPLELTQRIRAEAFSAVERLWKLAPDDLQSVRVQVAFRVGPVVGQRRERRS